jgi:transposase
MGVMKKHEVVLLPNEKKKLKAVVSTGQNKAAVIRRAHILLKADEGQTDAEISEMLYVSEQTIRRTRLRYSAEGLQVALEDKPHPKPTPKLNEQQEAHLVAVTCSAPPCIILWKSATDSETNRPVIPVEFGHFLKSIGIDGRNQSESRKKQRGKRSSSG